MASEAVNAKPPGALDLGKELTCSICTDILYQPLTVLDCLHTFCGSCLKEWFSWQAVQYEEHIRQSRTPKHASPFTCPSCRATVRETRPNATVTTLLEMHLTANPDQAKSQKDKEEISKGYKPGESVIPAIRTRRRNDEVEAENERVLEEVRQISLQDTQGGGNNQRARETSADRRRRMREERRVRSGEQTQNLEPRGRHTNERERSRSRETSHRQVAHQSSLRSLLSVSDSHSHGMEEEIMRQIFEEGLLDGIDLENIDTRQEEEISERIAQAYRRRRREVSTHSPENINTESRIVSGQSVEVPPQLRQESDRPTPQTTDETRPPLSRPHLINAATSEQHEPARSSSQENARQQPGSAGGSRAVSRSSTDHLEAPTSNTVRQTRSRPTSQENRRSTDPSPNRISDMWRRGAAGVSPAAQSTDTNTSQPAITRSQPSSPPLDSTSFAPPTSQTETPRAPSGNDLRPIYTEPLISCSSCNKPHIQYDLHYKCPKCTRNNTNVTLCLRCYRLGKGCDHWYGFGYAARARHDRLAPPGGYPPDHEPPHILQPQRYRRPPTPGGPVDPTLSPDPAQRLQTGFFCDNCLVNANPCFWHCNICNDGEWGFCHNCINKAQHCTHPLQALTSQPTTATPQDSTSANTVDRSQAASPMIVTLVPVETACNICRLDIPQSHTRFHCPTCTDGDYDICTSCYHSFVTSNRISVRDGPMGWRKCPSGHRMIVVGFEGREPESPRRYVIHDVVGGWALPEDEANDSSLKEKRAKEQAEGVGKFWSWRDEPNGGMVRSRHPSRYMEAAELPIPENGGQGLRMVAIWNRLPDEDAKNEITFPRGAEVREAADINGDWYWGIYCRKGGLFPGGYCKVVR